MKTMADIRDDEVPASDTRIAVVQYLTPHLKYFTPRAVDNVNFLFDFFLHS